MSDQKIKVLIIDDDDIDRMMIIRAVKLSGFTVDIFTASNIQAAISLVSETEFDCIFLDYNLPGNNGFDFLDHYKKNKGEVPVIMVTSKGDEHLAVEAMKKGAADYIPKNRITAESASQILRYALKIKEAESNIIKTEKVLQDTEKKLDAVIANTPLILFSIDRNGMINLFKGKGIENIQISPESVIGKSIFTLDVALPIRLKDYKNALLQNTLNAFVELNDHFYEVHYMPVLDDNKNTVGMNGVVMDITTVKKSEQELKNSLVIAEETQKIKEQFLANMSHEIRTPIHGILNLSDIVLKSHLSDEQHTYLNAIKKSADNLLVIINDILDLSKIEANKMTFENTEFKLLEVINLIIEMFKPRAIEKNIELILDYDENLPEFLNGDSARLTQIINNLIGNAIKFTPEGYVKIEIFSEEKNEKCCLVTFRISDSGIGIPQHKLTCIFDSFSQAASDITRKYGGTGLGLSICKSLIEMQGGMITVESNVNEGSQFTFHLSFDNTVHNTLDKQHVITVKGENQFNKKVKLLVVEDNDINRLVINKILGDWGFEIDNVADGTSAIDMIEQNNYDVVLMDIEMPGMNGYQATEYIRTKLTYPKNMVSILAMTAHANSEEKQKCSKAGMNDYISKPFEAQELKDKLISLCNKEAYNIEDKREEINQVSDEKQTDLKFLRELSENNESFFKDFIGLFLQNAPLSIADLHQTLNKKDWEGLRQAAHKIKPSLGYLGMKDIHLAAATIEDYARDQVNLDKIPELIKKIETVCSKAFIELEQELKELTYTN